MVHSYHAFRAAFIASIAAGLFAWLAPLSPASAQNLPEVQSGTLYLKSSPDAEAVEALRVATTMQAQITGNVARVHVIQQFSNTGSDWVEGLYVFPLAANAAVDELLMHVGERFNIIRFASDYSYLYALPRPVSAATRSEANRFIAALRASGGTEMRAPLERAMSTPVSEGFLQQIVFITDGSVGNEAELIALIHREIGAARLFTVGIGAAPNSYFLEQAAVAGRGSYTFIAEREQVGSRMQDLFHKLERPALVDLQLSWPDHLSADLAAGLPGDVYAGDPLVILARLPHSLSSSPGGSLTLSGRIRGEPWVHQVPITTVGEQSGLSKLWARERIADLSRQMQFGGDREQLRASILDLALRHHLVSEFTSLVAIDAEIVRAPGSLGYVEQGHVEQAPTSAPIGSYWATTGFAKTATPAELLLICGLLSIAFGCFLYWTTVARERAR